MKDVIFITDFDRTVTKKDFYWILLDDYIGQVGIDYYIEWKKTQRIGTQFLNRVFQWKKFTEEERLEAFNKVEVDLYFKDLLEALKANQIDRYILSAGFDQYIEYTLNKHKIEGVAVLTNPGAFREGCFIMEPDPASPYYSSVYGIDKGIVAKTYKEQCKTLIFVGDSEPDFHAAKWADLIFAKKDEELDRILRENQIAHYVFEDFQEIHKKLIELEILT